MQSGQIVWADIIVCPSVPDARSGATRLFVNSSRVVRRLAQIRIAAQGHNMQGGIQGSRARIQ